MRKPLFIFGAGGLGREILSFLRGSDLWQPAGFLDDGIPPGTVIKGLTVHPTTEFIRDIVKPVNMVLALGDPMVKQKVADRLAEISGITFPTLIHPYAVLQDEESIMIGPGSIITAGCILTSDVRIGSHVLINLNCTVGHNTIVGDFTSIMPGVNLAGQVTIGKSVLVGSGANIINRIRIGDRSRVGAGAVVTKDIPDDVVAVGVPAKIR